MYLLNLKVAFIAIFKSKSIMGFLVNIDRLGNALCGGHNKLTISGRTGYFALTKKSYYWKFLQWVIDSTFYPLDGKRHCYFAFKWERSKKYRRGNDVGLTLLSFVVIFSCLILTPIIYLISLLKTK